MQQKIHHFCLTPYRQGMSHLFILGGRCAPPTPATSYCEATPGHPVGEGEEGGREGGGGNGEEREGRQQRRYTKRIKRREYSNIYFWIK